MKDIHNGQEFNIFIYSRTEEIFSLVILIVLPLIFLAAIYFFMRFLSKRKRGVSAILLGNLLFTLFFLSSIFLVFEIYFRYIFNSTDSTISTKASQKWFRNNYSTNKSGFRDNIEYMNRIVPGKRRITFIGDSFAAGHGVAVDKRFANLIRQNNSDLEVHVMAVPGWNTAQELQMLKQLSETGYSFDIVVLVFFINDVECYRAPRGRQRYFSDGCFAKFLEKTYFGDHLVFRMELLLNQELKNYSVEELENYKDENIMAKMSADLSTMKKIVSNGGGLFIAVVFPLMQKINFESQEDEYVYEKIATVFKNNELPCLNLKNAFKKNTSDIPLVLNKFDAHPSEMAHFIAAEAISEFIDNTRR